jgi:hypothetical protein
MSSHWFTLDSVKNNVSFQFDLLQVFGNDGEGSREFLLDPHAGAQYIFGENLC